MAEQVINVNNDFEADKCYAKGLKLFVRLNSYLRSTKDQASSLEICGSQSWDSQVGRHQISNLNPLPHPPKSIFSSSMSSILI